MHEIQWAYVTVSKQYREHAFRKPPSTTMDGGILVPRAYDLFCQRGDRGALVSAITGCCEIHDIR